MQGTVSNRSPKSGGMCLRIFNRAAGALEALGAAIGYYSHGSFGYRSMGCFEPRRVETITLGHIQGHEHDGWRSTIRRGVLRRADRTSRLVDTL
jgi:hypothetical protein